MQPHGTAAKIELQKGEPRKPLCRLLRFKIVRSPKHCSCDQRNRNVFWKYRQFYQTSAIVRAEQLQAALKHSIDSAASRVASAPREPLRTFPVENLAEPLGSVFRRIALLDPLPQHRAGELESNGPLAQPPRENTGLRDIETRNPFAEKRKCFRLAHLIDIHKPRTRCNLRYPRGEESGASFPASKKRPEVSSIPHIVDHQQARPVFQLLPKLKRGILFVRKPRPLPSQRGIHGDKIAHHVGVLAERHPQDPIIEVLNDLFVVAQGRCKGRLAKPARSRKSGCNRHRLFAARAEQQILQLAELIRAVREIFG